MDDPVSRAIAVLNDALERDPEAITQLVNLRVECNAKLAAHPTVRVGLHEGPDGDVRKVGVLGLLNGVLGDSPGGVIGAKGRMDRQSGLILKVHEFVDLRLEKVDVIA